MIAGRVVEFQDKFLPFSNDDSQYMIQNMGEAIDLWLEAVKNRKTAEKAKAEVVVLILNTIVSTATISASIEKFVVKDKFIVDTSRKAKVKISYLGTSFKEWFWEKTEESFAGSTVYGRRLDKGSVDGPILNELGGSEKAETTLAEIYAMMKRQANGRGGAPLNNGWANIFYVRDITGTLRAVFVRWLGVGWSVDAHSVESPNEWFAGCRVFSRNSLVHQKIWSTFANWRIVPLSLGFFGFSLKLNF